MWIDEANPKDLGQGLVVVMVVFSVSKKLMLPSSLLFNIAKSIYVASKEHLMGDVLLITKSKTESLFL